MKTNWVLAALVVAVFGLFSVKAGERPAGPRGGGPVQEILDHAKELNLTADLKTKLEALQKEMSGQRGDAAGMREKMKDNPELREVAKEMKAARESGDEAKMKELREKIRAKTAGADGKPGEAKPGDGGREGVIGKIGQI